MSTVPQLHSDAVSTIDSALRRGRRSTARLDSLGVLAADGLAALRHHHLPDAQFAVEQPSLLQLVHTG